MLRRHRMPLVMVVVFVCAFVVAAVAVQAASEGGKMVMSRASKQTGRLPLHHQFSSPAGTVAGSCYGSCNCNVCVCYYNGDVSCCFAGCDACWQFLDEGGECSTSI